MTVEFWNDPLLESLNPAQRRAAEHVAGPLMILAGPGSGKTRVLIHRIANMIAAGVPSHQIVALTFTNKAADEMKSRLSQLVPEHHAWTGTFHRFCGRLLRNYASHIGLDENFTIYDHSDSKKVLKSAVSDSAVPLTHHTPDQIFNRISQAKSRALTPEMFEQAATSHLDRIAARIYPIYQSTLRNANAMDFDDMLLYVVTLLVENPELRETLDQRFRYVIVDEYQDTNTAQYLILKGLCQSHRNLAVTGDPDQSIYGWRGASLGNILDFEQDYPDVTVVRLEQNYRSTRSILGVADQLITNNQRRKHKQLLTDNDHGIPVSLVAYPSQKQEAESIAESIAWQVRRGDRQPGDFAIFYRVNAFSRSLEHALQSLGVPYQVVHGQEFYQRMEIKDLLAWLHLLNNPADNLALQRIINVPPRKIGAVTLKRIREFAEQQQVSMLEAARLSGMNSAMSRQAAAKVAAFVAIYDRLSEFVTGGVEEILGHVLSQTGYREWLATDESEEADNRIANVDELLTAAQEFDAQHPEDGGLQNYLETAVLVNETDAWETGNNSVTLMTLHAAKGLEFPVVFIVGIEEGTLPHERSMQDDEQVEEERRLLFVGITRAQSELQLSRALYRFRRGANWPTVASRFLMELPREQMTVIEPQGYQPDDEFSSEFDQQAHDEPWFSGDADQQVRSAPAVWNEAGHRHDADHRSPPVQIRTAADLFADALQQDDQPAPRRAAMLRNRSSWGCWSTIPNTGPGKSLPWVVRGKNAWPPLSSLAGKPRNSCWRFVPCNPPAGDADGSPWRGRSGFPGAASSTLRQPFDTLVF